MSAITRNVQNRRHHAGTIIGVTLITLAVFSLAVAMGALGDAIEVRAPAGFAFLASVITVTLMMIFDLIARSDRSGQELDGS